MSASPPAALPPVLETAARRIAAARSAGHVVTAFAQGEGPASLDEAYAVQRALLARWGERHAGWKVGATSKEVQSLFGVTEPMFGPVFAPTVFQSPARLRAADFQHLMLESEFAFRFATDLPARAEAYARDEVLAAVSEAIPAMEIVSPRFERLPVDNIPALVADFDANGGAVLGAPCAAWRDLDLPAHAVSLFIGGTSRQAGTGALVLGDPLAVLVWLANALSAQGLGIEAGQIVLTGSMTGVHAPEPGQAAVADFGALGRVEVTFD